MISPNVRLKKRGKRELPSLTLLKLFNICHFFCNYFHQDIRDEFHSCNLQLTSANSLIFHNHQYEIIIYEVIYFNKIGESKVYFKIVFHALFYSSFIP